MSSLALISARLGIDPAEAERVLAAGRTHEDPVWYVQLVLGIGAWVTAIAGLVFVGFLFFETLGLEESGFVVAALGTLMFAGALSLLAKRGRGEFVTQMTLAAGACGASIGVLGIGMETESFLATAIVAILFTIASIRYGRSALLQFLLALLVIAMLGFWVLDFREWLLIDVMALTLPVGVYLSLNPPRWNVAPSALALVLALPLSVLVVYYGELGLAGHGTAQGYVDWVAHGIATLSLVGLIVFIAATDGSGIGARPVQAAILGLAIVIAIFLPAGLTATLVIMLLGHALGRRSLAIVGALLFAYFLWAFYADLQQTLLVKSLILTVAGAALLVIRFLLGREPGPVEAKP